MIIFMKNKELSNSKWPVAGPRYFKYKGEWLNVIRKKHNS